MLSSFTGETETETDLRVVLRRLDAGEPPSQIETDHVDVKEEPGRRKGDGSVEPGEPRSEEAAQHLYRELACMSNTPGGGAIVVGVADDGRRPGTNLDPSWLRHRIYELSGRPQLTADIRAHHLSDGTRVLLCRVHEAVEPYRIDGRIYWRVDDNCVEVDAATWHAEVGRSHYDWSAEPSDREVDDVDPIAVAVARELLNASGETSATELAGVSDDRELVRRIPNIVAGGQRLTNAGRLLFTDVPPTLDYRRRGVPGGDTVQRVRRSGPLLVQLKAVFDALSAARRVVHIPSESGFVVGQHEALPMRSAREAVVNGVAHRMYGPEIVTEVEHVGDALHVTSPGGLVGPVTPENIITHPSTPRYRALSEALAKLRVAEREGIGVDRMYVDMLAINRPHPRIEEIPGPFVRTTLLGGEPDSEWVIFRAAIHPAPLARSLDVLMALDLAADRGWVDVEVLADRIQRGAPQAAEVLRSLEGAEVRNADGTSAGHVLVRVDGQPERPRTAWRPGAPMRRRLGDRIERATSGAAREELLLGYAATYGRISSTEAADLADLSVNYAGQLLKNLEDAGHLRPSRPNRRGQGFHYVWAGAPEGRPEAFSS